MKGATESFERPSDLNYKYDFLENKNVSDEIGFTPNCERRDWNEGNIEVTEEVTNLPISLFDILRHIWAIHYGRFEGMHHRRKEGRK